MAKSSKTATPDSVEELLNKLDPAFRQLVEQLRRIILAADPRIGEQVKWNSPSYFYTGPMKDFDPKTYKRDIVVMNLRHHKILLVFPTGSAIDDKTGILEGDYADGRRMIRFDSAEQINARSGDLQSVIRNWLDQIEVE